MDDQEGDDVGDYEIFQKLKKWGKNIDTPNKIQIKTNKTNIKIKKHP